MLHGAIDYGLQYGGVRFTFNSTIVNHTLTIIHKICLLILNRVVFYTKKAPCQWGFFVIQVNYQNQ